MPCRESCLFHALSHNALHRWYRGTVVLYDAKRDTHHVKYADKDKLDICVRHEAVILITEHEVRCLPTSYLWAAWVSSVISVASGKLALHWLWQ